MLKIYALTLSSPALKVLYVANYLGLEYEQEGVDIAGGGGQSAEYKSIHPAGKVPAIVDGDFKLWESNAIIRYLADRESSDLYPRSLKQRAIVDQWMDFANIHIQNGVGRVFWNKVVAPKFGREVDESSLKCGLEFIERFFPIVDEQLGKYPYIAGDKISIADFALLAHTDPLELIEIDDKQYPNLKKWRDQLRKEEFYQKVHKVYGEAVMAQ